TMNGVPAVCDEAQVLVNCRRGDHVLLQGIRPEQSIRGYVAGSSGIDALEPSLGFSPPEIAATGDVQPVLVNAGHPVEIAGAFPAIAIESMHVGFGSVRIEVELPDGMERKYIAGVLG